MFKLIMIAAAVSVSSAALADGFQCQTVERDLNIKIYNHVSPEAGTRNAAVMVFSDPAIQAGRKTIATFTDAKGTLENESVVYYGNVDLRVTETSRKGEIISGTKLGALKSVILGVNFSYAQPVKEGTSVHGILTLIKRDGRQMDRDLECVRYLKGN